MQYSSLRSTVGPVVTHSLIDRLTYFLSDRFVDDLAKRTAQYYYELEQRDARRQTHYHGIDPRQLVN